MMQAQWAARVVGIGRLNFGSRLFDHLD